MAALRPIAPQPPQSIRRVLGRPRIHLVLPARLENQSRRLEERVLVLTAWRLHLFGTKLPPKASSSFNVLEIRSISTPSPTQVRVETERGPFPLAFACPEAAARLTRALGAALGRALPSAPPPWPRPPESPLDTSPTSESSASTGHSVCGGFSETYAALCDYNGVSCREEVQWDVDTIYHAEDNREFNLLDFSHLDSRDLALAVSALAYNHWFRALSCRDLRLGGEVVEQVLHAVSRSPSLEELILDNAGLKADFATRLAAALGEHPAPPLRSLVLAHGPVDDRGLTALSQRFLLLPGGLRRLSLPHAGLGPRGLWALSRALGSNPAFRSRLQHLDLSRNPGLLGAPDGAGLYSFLAQPNALLHLDLASTDCAVDVLFGALLHGCCPRLNYLNVARNTFSHRKARETPPTLRQFFCSAFALAHVSLAGVRVPPDALRSLFQGLAANTHLSDVHLDLSGCELRSPGARVLRELLGGVSAVGSLDLSDNGFDADLLTLVPVLGKNKALKHLWLGKNFNVKARTLEEILQKLVQMIQEEDCSLQSLSVADSRLKARTSILVNALGSNACLAKVDLSGNLMEDVGAKMLAKALQINSTLRSLAWDRNNTTAVGFQDIARAMQSNYTLTFMALPLSDLTAAYRSAPERTDAVWQKIQWCLLRNGRGPKVPADQALRLHRGIVTSTAEQMLCRLSGRVQATARGLRGHPGAQRDLAEARELLREARNARSLFPSLAALGRVVAGDGPVRHLLESVAGDVAKAVDKELQAVLEALAGRAARLCPRALGAAEGRWGGRGVRGAAARRLRPPPGLARGALLEQAGQRIRHQLGEVTLAAVTFLTNAVVEELLRELRRVHRALAQHLGGSPEESGGPPPPPRGDPLNSTDEELGTAIVRGGTPKRGDSGGCFGVPPPPQDTLALQRPKRCRRIRPTSAFLGHAEGPPRRDSPSPPSSPEGALPHCTRARPRPPHRPPSRTPGGSQAEAGGGPPLDEGLEEFFTRRVLPRPPPPPVPPLPPQRRRGPPRNRQDPQPPGEPEPGHHPASTQEQGWSPGSEEAAPPSIDSPRVVEGAGLPSPQAPPPQALPTSGAWPAEQQSPGGEEGGGATLEAPPTAPTGTSNGSRRPVPPKPKRTRRAQSCDKMEAEGGEGGGT
ncbi:capping protein, Arp2/3 and myosin-I linker protein 3 [Morphnus guianensis]